MAVRATKNITTEPTVTDATPAAVPSMEPKRKPPVSDITSAPGNDRLTSAA